MKNKGVRRLTKLRVLRMGIKFTCPHCGKSLNVKSSLAGRRGLCPHCKGRVEIPTPSSSAESVSVAQGAVAPILPVAPMANVETSPVSSAPPVRPSAGPNVKAFEDLDTNSFLLDRPQLDLEPKPQTHFDWIADSPESVWYVRNRAGGQYGPAVGAIMRTWLQEGRVSRECYVWREGWAHWRQANDVFPHWFEPRANGVQPGQSVSPKPWHPNPQVHKAVSEQRSAAPSQAVGQPTVVNRSPSPSVSASVSPLMDNQPNLASPSRSNSATWLFVAILAFVLTLSGVAITTVVYMIKKSNEVKAPNTSTPPAELRDPFS